jgi:hypothetical protein
MLQIAVAASPQSFVIMQFVDYVYVLLIWKYENFLCSHRSLHTMNGECCRVSVLVKFLCVFQTIRSVIPLIPMVAAMGEQHLRVYISKQGEPLNNVSYPSKAAN